MNPDISVRFASKACNWGLAWVCCGENPRSPSEGGAGAGDGAFGSACPLPQAFSLRSSVWEPDPEMATSVSFRAKPSAAIETE